MRISVLIICIIFFANISKAQNPNWAEHISPILYQSCTPCHKAGGIGKFSLLEYQQAADKKYSIKNYVKAKLMPPWIADPSYRRFAHERLLTQKQIDDIVLWVDNGAPSGDLSKAPTKPNYSNSSQLGTIDLSLKIPTYTSTASTSDLYRCFNLNANNSSAKFLSGIEIIPGNPDIVHHVLVFQDTTNTTLNLDNADPMPGYTNFGGTGSNTSVLIGAWVPGSTYISFVQGTGIKLYKNAKIILQIHYPKGTNGQKDSTRVNFRFSNGTNTREVFISPLLNHANITNGPLFIPKNTLKTFNQSFTAPIKATLLSILPHMHLIGKSTKIFVRQANGDSIPLIKINNWDFHWQGEYKFQKAQIILPLSKIESIVVYDNTINNPFQPDPSNIQNVSAGEATTQEMALTYFYFMAYKNGDENIIQDSSLILKTSPIKIDNRQTLINPNPSSDLFTVSSLNTIKAIDIVNTNGILVKSIIFDTQNNKQQISIKDIPKGIYYIKTHFEMGTEVNRLIKL